jgi:flagellar protein FliL
MSKPHAPAPAAGDAPPKSKKKLIVFGIIIVLVLAIVGGAAAFLLKKKAPAGKGEEEAHVEEPAKAPVFIPMEPFTVNLQSEGHDKYLQLTMTLQVDNDKQVDPIKANMPQVRSRLLMLLSSKDAEEIMTKEGKDKLVEEIITQINTPFTPKGDPQKVSGVFFTSFVIQ